MKEPTTIRTATVDDLPAINAIYNHHVLTSTCTYQTDPESEEDRRAWFTARSSADPVTVAVLGGEVVGWGRSCRSGPGPPVATR
jgi:phosphinothricin acetyltransferase